MYKIWKGTDLFGPLLLPPATILLSVISSLGAR